MLTRPYHIKPIVFFVGLSLLLMLPLCTITFLTRDFYRQHQNITKSSCQALNLTQKPLLQIVDGVLRQVDPSGRYELQVHAQKTDIMRNSSQIICNTVLATIINQSNQKIEITADQGIIKQDEKLVYFTSSVQAKSDDIIFQGSQMSYYFNRHEFSSPQPFTIKNPAVVMQASQGTFNIKTWQAHLNGKVITTLTQHDSPPLR